MVFNVILSKKHKKEARREGYLKKFKLEKNITTTNMHLLMDEMIKKYHTPEESKWISIQIVYHSICSV